MRFNLLTYNVLFNRAYKQLHALVKKYRPDIICLQEVDTSETNLKALEDLGYSLADYANSFIQFGKIYGIATFYNPTSFEFGESKSIFLPKSIYELFLTILKVLRGGQKPRTLLGTTFIHKKTKKELVIYNTHLTTYGSKWAALKADKRSR